MDSFEQQPELSNQPKASELEKDPEVNEPSNFAATAAKHEQQEGLDSKSAKQDAREHAKQEVVDEVQEVSDVLLGEEIKEIQRAREVSSPPPAEHYRISYSAGDPASESKPAQDQVLEPMQSKRSAQAASDFVPLNLQSDQIQTASMRNKRTKKKLLAYQNGPSFFVQLRDLTSIHWRHLCGSSCIVVVLVIVCPLICAFSFLNVKVMTTEKSYPGWNLERLKHPVYSTSYFQPQDDEFYSDFDTSLNQQLRFEDFFNFADYQNTERAIGKDADGKTIKKNSYSPGLDTFGPGSWMPMQCYSSVDYKYASPVIGYIKNGNTLEDDLLTQVQSIFRDQTSIDTFSAKLEEFLSKVSIGGGSPPSDEEAETEDAGAAGSGKEEASSNVPDDPNTFVVDEKLMQEGGGGPPNPHEVDTSKMGRLIYKEFQSKDDLFEYVQQEGYGWDPEVPAVCFAFQIQENEEKNRYELEWIVRDTWPVMNAPSLRMDKKVDPMDIAQILLGYTRVAYNGLNLMQVFAANSIMQRRIDPKAEIVMFTIPYQIGLERSSAINEMTVAFMSPFSMFVLIPLGFYTAYKLGLEKESGLKDELLKSGMSPIAHFLSWVALYSLLNLIVSLVYSIGLKAVIFGGDSFFMLFFLFFFGNQSVFGLIWALQALTKTSKMAVLAFGFMFWLSYFLANLVNQTDPVISSSTQYLVSILAPVGGIQLTMDTLAKFHKMFWEMNFENWDLVKMGWSLFSGFTIYIINFFVWILLGVLFDTIGYFLDNICSKRKKLSVSIQNSNENTLQIIGMELHDPKNQGQAPIYNLTIQKGEVCCLIGNNSAQKTSFLEMLAGLQPCARLASLTIKDSDFFVRSEHPDFKDFMVYRSQRIVLDDELTAMQHLNLFAHMRGNQKYCSTRVLCEKLLPEAKKVGLFSESQRQCLQTLLALASENTKVLLLDEPTRGLGAEQRMEMMKTLWRFKKDRYVIISSSDADLVSMLADSVARVMPSGIQAVTRQEAEQELASYKLSVKVEEGKPSNNLVKFLSHDVDAGLTLEFHSEEMTHYILPNIPKSLVYKKSSFMEANKKLLGLLSFEFVSLTELEVSQRNIPDPYRIKQNAVGIVTFDESQDDYLFEGDDADYEDQNILEKRQSSSQGPALQSVQVNQVEIKPDSARADVRSNQAFIINPDEVSVGDKGVDDNRTENASQMKRPQMLMNEKSSQEESDSEEMREFKQILNSPFRRPNTKRELFFDFKNFRSERKFCATQCCGIFMRLWKQNWNNKCQCLAMFVMPALAMALNYYCARSYFFWETESRLIDPDWLPLHRIVANEKTVVGDRDTKKYIEKMPKYEESFETTYVSTEGHEIFRDFSMQVFDFCMNDAAEQPWSYGSYQFYDMDEDKHQYQFMTYVNVTSPFSAAMYPQFMIESILKNALADDNFEFKVTQTPLPAPKEIAEKGSFISSLDLYKTKLFVVMVEVVGFWAKSSQQVAGSLCFCWCIINSMVLLNTMRERTSGKKHFFESHGQSKLAYWLAKFVHDIIFYVPLAIVTAILIEKFDQQMEQATTSILIAPLAMIPFIYVLQLLFTSELSALMTLLITQIIIQYIMPFLVVALRLNPTTEPAGDFLFKLFKLLPFEAPMSSIFFNSETLAAIYRYRDFNVWGKGDTVQTDEDHPMNAPADRTWIIVHTVFFWTLLICVIEYRLPFLCCDSCRQKEISQFENDEYFGRGRNSATDTAVDAPADEQVNNNDSSDISEVAEIVGDGSNLQLRFNVRQKPMKQLALKVHSLTIRSPRSCCTWLCCRKKPIENPVVSDLAMQVQAGSKFAIIADSSQGKTSVIDALTSRRSALRASAVLSKQIGRGAPIYTSQRSDQIFHLDLTMQQNIDYFSQLGSIHPRIVKLMIVSFNLSDRLGVLMGELNETERHLTQLIVALSSSNRTIILDEPFTGLSTQQILKFVKIIRQKHNCTVIVTAKTKSQLELFQPHQMVQIQHGVARPAGQLTSATGNGYLVAIRLRYNQDEKRDAEMGVKDDLLSRIFAQNFGILEKLRFKKRSLIMNVIFKLLKKAQVNQVETEAIAETIYEDLQLEMTSDELVIKCQLIRHLYQVVEAFCKQFGECHIELQHGQYVVLRVIDAKNMNHEETEMFTSPTPEIPSPHRSNSRRGGRLLRVQDSQNDRNRQRSTTRPNSVLNIESNNRTQSFSEIVNFVNTNEVIKQSSLSCHFLSSAHNFTSSGNSRNGSKASVKMFRYSAKQQELERINFGEKQTSSHFNSHSTLPQN